MPATCTRMPGNKYGPRMTEGRTRNPNPAYHEETNTHHPRWLDTLATVPRQVECCQTLDPGVSGWPPSSSMLAVRLRAVPTTMPTTTPSARPSPGLPKTAPNATPKHMPIAIDTPTVFSLDCFSLISGPRYRGAIRERVGSTPNRVKRDWPASVTTPAAVGVGIVAPA